MAATPRTVERAHARIAGTGVVGDNLAARLDGTRADALQKAAGPSRDAGIGTLILLLAPFAPHVTEELWHRRGGEASVHLQRWPSFDASLAAATSVTIVIQVSGKVRDRIEVPAGTPEAELKALALRSPKVQAALNGGSPLKVIAVPDRLVNVVVK